MNISNIRRPWIKSVSQGRKHKDLFYQSVQWKQTRAGFIQSPPWIKLPPINGIGYSNKHCADCWENGKINDERIEVDHIHARADGGDPFAYSNLRSRCHAHHNAKTHNERKVRFNK